MKSTSSDFAAHLDREVTTICTCWRIVRTDGKVFAFTSHDVDLTINGVLYDSAHGYSKTAISSSSDLSVDNLDVTGIIDSDTITDQDLRNGLFNFADVFLFATDWTNPNEDDLKLRRGTFGEVTVGQNGMFITEIRGLQQAFSHNYIEVFTPDCKADFCDSRCKLAIKDFEIPGTVISVTDSSRTAFGASAVPGNTEPTSVGAHRDWRIFLTTDSSYTETNPDTEVVSTHAGFAEFVAWDQDGNLIGGDVEQHSSSSVGGHEASKIRDGNSSTTWICATQETSVGQWCRIRFGANVDIKEFMVQASTSFGDSPTAFLLQYSDDWDDDTQTGTWHLAKDCNASWSSNGQRAVWGIGSGSGDPINYPDSPITVPPPFTGASTYIGGTIRWVSGDNAGRTLEIIEYDDGAVTLFDGCHYEIKVGDTFMIAQGCDKMRATCVLYENIVNMRGEPDVPGQDEFLFYPDAQK